MRSVKRLVCHPVPFLTSRSCYPHTSPKFSYGRQTLEMIPPSVLALIRNTPTIAPVPHRAVISVAGPQAAEFLNGLIASSIPSSSRAHFFSAFLHAQASSLLCCISSNAHDSSDGSHFILKGRVIHDVRRTPEGSQGHPRTGPGQVRLGCPKQSQPGPAASDQGPTYPTLRANPFPEVTDLFCRLPLSTLFYQLEAVHLGDLLRL